LQADAEKPEQSRQKKNCIAMKTMTLEQMNDVHGGSWRAILLCAGIGAMYALANPVAGLAAAIICGFSAEHEEM
jgi:hypothetical protein